MIRILYPASRTSKFAIQEAATSRQDIMFFLEIETAIGRLKMRMQTTTEIS